MEKIEIRIEPLNKFLVKYNGKPIGEFTQVSKWEGLTKLKGDKGIIIIEDTPHLYEPLFPYEIIKASPRILAEIAEQGENEK